MTIIELPEDLALLVSERIHSLDPAGLVILLEPGDDESFSLPKTMTLTEPADLLTLVLRLRIETGRETTGAARTRRFRC